MTLFADLHNALMRWLRTWIENDRFIHITKVHYDEAFFLFPVNANPTVPSYLKKKVPLYAHFWIRQRVGRNWGGLPVPPPLVSSMLKVQDVDAHIRFFTSLRDSQAACMTEEKEVEESGIRCDPLPALIRPIHSEQHVYLDAVVFGTSFTSVLVQRARTKDGIKTILFQDMGTFFCIDIVENLTIKRIEIKKNNLFSWVHKDETTLKCICPEPLTFMECVSEWWSCSNPRDLFEWKVMSHDEFFQWGDVKPFTQMFEDFSIHSCCENIAACTRILECHSSV